MWESNEVWPHNYVVDTSGFNVQGPGPMSRPLCQKVKHISCHHTDVHVFTLVFHPLITIQYRSLYNFHPFSFIYMFCSLFHLYKKLLISFTQNSLQWGPCFMIMFLCCVATWIFLPTSYNKQKKFFYGKHEPFLFGNQTVLYFITITFSIFGLS